MSKVPYLKLITVRGSLPFPIDMLRYDRSWPHDEGDASRIEETHAGNAPVLYDIELVSWDMPNRERWLSLCWEVVRVERKP